MQHHQHVELCLSQPDVLILACLIHEPKTATAWHEAAEGAIEQGIEPGAFARMVARLERRGLVEAMKAEPPLRLYRITALGLLAIEQAGTHRQGEKLEEGGSPDWQRGRKIIMRLVLWILHLYPPAWRERYEAEMVALLEQHALTLWTVVDLLVGALDARLDPHYRRKRQLLPLRRLQASWRWFASACVGGWLGLAIWIGMWDMPIDPATVCSAYPGDIRCPTRVAIGMHTPQLSSALLTTWFVPIAFLSLLVFLAVLARWVVAQTIQRKQWWNLLRLLPIASFILICFYAPFPAGRLNGFVQAVFVASIALLAESGGAMLISAKTWEKRQHLLSALSVRLLAFLVLVGMAAFCIASGVWLIAIWNLLPQLNFYYPGLPNLLMVGFVTMALAIISACFALVRSTFALTKRSIASLKQEPLS
jgi:DNA-binding MarR family transcriptional regulator